MTLGRTNGALWVTCRCEREKLRMDLRLQPLVAGKTNRPHLRKEASEDMQV